MRRNILALVKWIMISSVVLLLMGCATSSLVKKVGSQTQGQQLKIDDALGKDAGHNFTAYKMRYVNATPMDIPAAWKQKHVAINAVNQPLAVVLGAMTADTRLHNVYEPSMPKKAVSLHFTGTLNQALVHLAANNDIDYTVERGSYPTLRWAPYITRTFEIAYMPGTTQFSLGNLDKQSTASPQVNAADSTTSTNSSPPGVTQGNSTGRSKEGSSLSGQVDVWRDLATGLGKLTSKKGSFAISEATTSVTVTDKPYFIRRIADYIVKFNALLSSRVAVKVRILEVNLSNSSQRGINWNAVYKAGSTEFKLLGNFVNPIDTNPGGTSSAGGGSVQATILKGPWANSNFLIQALDEQGNTSIVTEPTIVSLNNQPSTISIGSNKSYVKSTSVTANGSGKDAQTTTQFVPGTINAGLTMSIVPHIQNNKVYMSLDVKMTTLKDIQEVDSKDKSSLIQLPDTVVRAFNQRIMADNNSMIVLSGFKERNDLNEVDKNFGSSALGGQGAQVNNKELVVLIQPQIMR